MIPSLDPVTLIREAWQRSRLLRFALIVAVLTILLLLGGAVAGRVDWTIGAVLLAFNVGVWYFALATARAFGEHHRLTRSETAAGLERVAHALALIAIGFTQALFLIMVLRLLDRPD